jgi:hypothetical protein
VSVNCKKGKINKSRSKTKLIEVEDSYDKVQRKQGTNSYECLLREVTQDVATDSDKCEIVLTRRTHWILSRHFY